MVRTRPAPIVVRAPTSLGRGPAGWALALGLRVFSRASPTCPNPHLQKISAFYLLKIQRPLSLQVNTISENWQSDLVKEGLLEDDRLSTGWRTGACILQRPRVPMETPGTGSRKQAWGRKQMTPPFQTITFILYFSILCSKSFFAEFNL